MKSLKRLTLFLAAAFCNGGYVSAEVLLGEVQACLVDKLEDNQPLAQCIDAAHMHCASIDEGAKAVATLCFTNAENSWKAGIAEQMSVVKMNATEEIAAIASIETKYDLLASLLQCDRLEELQLTVGRDEEEDILRENARCKAGATALTYTRLYVRSRDMK